MKRPIKWHQECLKNHLVRVEQEEKALDDKRREVKRLRADYEFAAYQLMCAIKEDKGGYDPDRYKVKRPKRSEK
jgi:hypothetical protein